MGGSEAMSAKTLTAGQSQVPRAALRLVCVLFVLGMLACDPGVSDPQFESRQSAVQAPRATLIDHTPATDSPTRRAFAGMAFDADRQRFVMFGGRDRLDLDDVWEHDGQLWRPIQRVEPWPDARHNPSIVYDPVTRRVLVFGGETVEDELLGDLWAWDGVAWAELEPGNPRPAPQAGASMVFDPSRQLLVLAPTVNEEAGQGFWELEPQTGRWTLRRPADERIPNHMFRPRLSWDPLSQQVLVWSFGGGFGNDFYLWRGADGVFSDVSEGPHSLFGRTGSITYLHSLSRHMALAESGYDPSDLRLVGVDPQDPAFQTVAQEGLWPAGRYGLASAWDADAERLLMFGGESEWGFLHRDTWTWTPEGQWESWQYGTAQPSERSSPAVSRGLDGEPFVFGGQDEGREPLADTWRLVEGRWVPYSTELSPPPRAGHAMAYFPPANQVVLFGGESRGVSLGDTWVFTEAGWEQYQGEPTPTATIGATLGLSPGGDELWLLGGRSWHAARLWAWDGNGWRLVAEGDSVPERDTGHQLIHDPVHARSLLFRRSEPPLVHDGDTWTELDLGEDMSTVAAAWNPQAMAVDFFARTFTSRTFRLDGDDLTELHPPRGYVGRGKGVWSAALGGAAFDAGGASLELWTGDAWVRLPQTGEVDPVTPSAVHAVTRAGDRPQWLVLSEHAGWRSWRYENGELSPAPTLPRDYQASRGLWDGRRFVALATGFLPAMWILDGDRWAAVELPEAFAPGAVMEVPDGVMVLDEADDNGVDAWLWDADQRSWEATDFPVESAVAAMAFSSDLDVVLARDEDGYSLRQGQAWRPMNPNRRCTESTRPEGRLFWHPQLQRFLAVQAREDGEAGAVWALDLDAETWVRARGAQDVPALSGAQVALTDQGVLLWGGAGQIQELALEFDEVTQLAPERVEVPTGQPFELFLNVPSERWDEAPDLWADSLPPGASFDRVTGQLSWPGVPWSGTYTTVFTASGPGLCLSQTTAFEIINRPPVVPDIELQIERNMPVEIELAAMDPEGQPLTFQVESNPGHGSIRWHDFVMVRYVPDEGYAGTDSFRFSASDGVHRTVAEVRITIEAVPSGPVVPAQFAATIQTVPVTVDIVVQNLDVDDLTFSVATAPEHGLATVDGARLTYRPNNDFRGVDSLVIGANDGELTGYGPLQISVRPAHRLYRYATTPGEALVADLARADPGVPVSFWVSQQPIQGSVSLDGSIMTYQPEPEFVGEDRFLLVRSVEGVFTEDEVTITIADPNRRPIIETRRIAATEDVDGMHDIVVFDPDGDEVELRILAPASAGDASLDGTTLEYAPLADFHGRDRVLLVATDGVSQSDVAVVDIEVAPVNDAPHAAHVAATFQSGEPLRVQLLGTDVDGDELTYRSDGTWPEGLEIEGSLLVGSVALSEATRLAYVVHDGQTESAPANVTLTPTSPPNQSPELVPIRDREDAVGDTVRIEIHASDPEGDDVALEVRGLPRGTSAQGNLIVGVLDEEAHLDSPYRVHVQANDGASTTAISFLWEVTGSNRPPKLQPLSSRRVMVGDELTIQLAASDDDADVLLFSASGLPADSRFDSVAGWMTWTPGATSVGVYTVEFAVTDGEAWDREPLRLEVVPEPDVPAVGLPQESGCACRIESRRTRGWIGWGMRR